MPEIILEENEGESVIERRAAVAAAQAAVAAGNANNDNANANNNNDPADVAPSNNNNQQMNNSMTSSEIAAQIQRLVGVDVRHMFRRIGVHNAHDTKFLRERDLDTGMPQAAVLQKRKTWGILKFIAMGKRIEPTTTLTRIHKTLTDSKKNKDSSFTTGHSSRATAQQLPIMATTVNPSLIPTVQLSRSANLDPFDGSYQNWILWKNKAKFTLSQTTLGTLIWDGEEGEKVAKRCPGRDYLLFNILAEAIVGGSARHLIEKAQKQSSNEVFPPQPAAAAAAAVTTRPKSGTGHKAASGRILWKLLLKEYMQGHMAFWILSDARQTLQKLRLVEPENAAKEHNKEKRKFMVKSAFDYVQAFRDAKTALEEYSQALPDQFLSSTFVDHISDERFATVKNQLLKDLTTKEEMSLESCISELLMADHMIRSRDAPNERKRALEQDGHDVHEHGQKDVKRLKADDVGSSQDLGE